MQGKLFIVGTPIGNLGDLSFRGKEVLSSVDYIACEDTRHSSLLLKHYEIKKPLISYHKHNERESTEKILELLNDSKHVALISDAGMPAICDPGAYLIKTARESGIIVESVPGPTALTSAISIAGNDFTGFTFLGFLPEKESSRKKIIDEFKGSSLPFVFYCAPHDIEKNINFIYERIGDREVILVKEISKIFESVVFAKLSEVKFETVKGEYVAIVLPERKSVEESEIIKALHNEIKMGYKKSQAIKNVSDKLNVPKNEVYGLALSVNANELEE
ncbi:MAG: Ribosomal RNA small subunit methyltransferase I [Firmicutes bacterium ADurb.Bin080]|jgi:16S rRNA (cytidine1402-2'-O)-methyltransferase|nr:16S rRNA (cytidine(1402)-2'-O)-methyltransferase [Clostridiales bacterium]OQC15565.1 MAG: Ribosomal RNA small subunit methyltransferase I [Firmicutes bacterium ADurb.Bin080]